MNSPTASNINLPTLDQAVDLMRLNKLSEGSREATFLRTYPAVLVSAKSSDRAVTETFLMTAAFVYGWMPGILRVESQRLDAAAKAFDTARAQDAEFSEGDVKAVASCLQSLVAASKVLHFANPYLYPLVIATIIFIAVLVDTQRTRILDAMNRRTIRVEEG